MMACSAMASQLAAARPASLSPAPSSHSRFAASSVVFRPIVAASQQSSQLSWSQSSLVGCVQGISCASASDGSASSSSGRGRVARRHAGIPGLVVRAVVPKGLVDVSKIDETKFDSLILRRVVFGHDDWRKHKSSGRYWRQLRTMFTSKIISALGPPVLVITGIASAVVGWNELVLQHVLPDGTPILHMSSLPFSLTVPALSFLLVFRTNASYGRFDEARKMWGLMLNRTRDICRQSLSYMARDEFAYEYPKRAQFLRHLQSFGLCYKHHFLQEGSLEEDLRNFTSLTEDEIQATLAATHRPNYCLQMMSECMRSCHMEPIHRFAMETNMVTFADDIGGSERLFKTPIPLSYTRLTSRFMILYHMLLPFALWDALGWVTIPATILCTGIFFCIEEVGVLIENPFPVLALDVIAQSSRNNIGELISLHEGIRNRVVADDLTVKMMPATQQEQMLPHEPTFVPEPDPAYLSDWAEEDGALTSSPSSKELPYAAKGPYSL